MSDNLPAKVSETDQWMALIERVLTVPDLQISNLERILALRDKERHEAALEALNHALAACQAEIKQVARDKPNSAFNSRYSSHKAMDDEARPVAEKYGLAWTVTWLTTENNIVVFEGTLSLGRAEKTFRLPVALTSLTNEGPRGGRMAQTPIQVIGSITTYMRKYLLMLAFNIVPADNADDDDGESLRFRRPPPPPRPPGWQPQPQHTEPSQPRPNGEGWMKNTLRMLDEEPNPAKKTLMFTMRLEPIWHDLARLETFAGDAAWLAYEPEFPPDKEMLQDVLDKRLDELRELRRESSDA